MTPLMLLCHHYLSLLFMNEFIYYLLIHYEAVLSNGLWF